MIVGLIIPGEVVILGLGVIDPVGVMEMPDVGTVVAEIPEVGAIVAEGVGDAETAVVGAVVAEGAVVVVIPVVGAVVAEGAVVVVIPVVGAVVAEGAVVGETVVVGEPVFDGAIDGEVAVVGDIPCVGLLLGTGDAEVLGIGVLVGQIGNEGVDVIFVLGLGLPVGFPDGFEVTDGISLPDVGLGVPEGWGVGVIVPPLICLIRLIINSINFFKRSRMPLLSFLAFVLLVFVAADAGAETSEAGIQFGVGVAVGPDVGACDELGKRDNAAVIVS